MAAAIVDPRVIFGALVGAISWNLITWYYGIPSSSSHALIGGLIGAGVAKAGMSSIVWSGVIKTTLAIAGSPLTGFFLALLLMLIVSWAVHPLYAVCGRQHVPQSAVHFRLALFAGTWRQ